MKQVMIDRFFKLLDQELGLAADIILVGASAGSLMGHIRPSLDIDFEIRLRSSASPERKERVRKAIENAQAGVRVATNYSENISGWSRIDYLDYRKTAKLYKRFGKLTVKLIAPEYWTIGKMARYLELDHQDIQKILKQKKVTAKKVIGLWARAVKSSDLSLELGQFREHVLHFLKSAGKKVWGKEFDAQKWQTFFVAKCAE